MPPLPFATVTLFARLLWLTTPEPAVPEFWRPPPAPGHWLPAELGVAAPEPPPIEGGLMLAKPGTVRPQAAFPVVPILTCELSLIATPNWLLAFRTLFAQWQMRPTGACRRWV